MMKGAQRRGFRGAQRKAAPYAEAPDFPARSTPRSMHNGRATVHT